MAANVTGGAAGQCSDLLHDLKTGMLVGARLRYQAIAQVFGVLSGSLAGTAAYLILIPEPREMLLTEEWPAPAVAAWKAVADVLAEGFHTIPEGCLGAMIIAGIIGVALACLEKFTPEDRRKWIPSASSMGFAFILPANLSLTLFAGALIGVVVGSFAPDWRKKYLIVIAAGLVAGESLMGVAEGVDQSRRRKPHGRRRSPQDDTGLTYFYYYTVYLDLLYRGRVCVPRGGSAQHGKLHRQPSPCRIPSAAFMLKPAYPGCDRVKVLLQQRRSGSFCKNSWTLFGSIFYRYQHGNCPHTVIFEVFELYCEGPTGKVDFAEAEKKGGEHEDQRRDQNDGVSEQAAFQKEKNDSARMQAIRLMIPVACIRRMRTRPPPQVVDLALDGSGLPSAR